MFPIQKRSSLSRNVLLTLFLEFTFVNKSTSNQGACEVSNPRNIDYFKVGTEEVDWNTAWHLCNNLNSFLPAICNQNGQHTLTNYLKTYVKSSAIWTAGKKIIFNNWIWINGEIFSGYIRVRHETYTHVALDEKRFYKEESPQNHVNYLCQYSGFLCNHKNDTNVTNDRCLRPSIEDRTWYNARNQCLLSGGDLATLNDADLNIIRNSNKLNRSNSYWIGLRKISWRWSWNKTAMLKADSSDEIKYINWSNDSNSLYGECISVGASNGEWKAVGCTEKKKVVCQRNLRSTTVQSAASSSTSSLTETTTQGPSSTDSQVLIYAGVSAGIVIISICIIVIIIAIRSTRKSAQKVDHSKANNNSEQSRLQELPNKPANAPVNTLTNAPANAPVNVPMKTADDVLGVYAEIPLASINQSEENATNQQPGLVYASLEFQKEPTYAEPNKKLDNPTYPAKVGPLGDTYAIPDAKGHAVSSPSTSSVGSSSHPIRVSAQGDVYALPVKNSKSPNANSPGGNVYANLK